MSRPRHIRLFLSSPGDVTAERAIVLSVLDQLPYDPLLRGKISLEVVAWDKPGADTPMLATLTPQEAINRGLPLPAQCDIVVVIFWSRMGTPLPEKYTKADGSRYLSGTEWEYLNAYETASTEGTPLLIIYRRTEEVILKPADKDFLKKYEQWQRVEDFFDDFVNADGSIEHGYNPYPTPDEFRAKFETHIRVLVSQLLDAPERDIPLPDHKGDEVIKIVEEQWQGSPFPGLRAFEEKDAPIFFGRGQETDALVQMVKANRFVAVVGASGSGKSSLVGAGLIPGLRKNAIMGSKDWKIMRLKPDVNPFLGLYKGLIQVFPSMEPNPLEEDRIKTNFIAGLQANPASFLEICQKGLKNAPDWAEVLLFIDQFEELFTLTDEQWRPPFVQLLTMIAQSQKVRVVITMRHDFYPKAIELPALATLLNISLNLAAPERDTLREMIERPAERAELHLETGLVKHILDDTGNEPGNLALMAYALDELYQLDDDRRLTHAEYEQLGGVKGAIGTRAENQFRELALPDSVIQQVFRALVEVDEKGTATRRRECFQRNELSRDVLTLIEAFTDARLLTTNYDAATQTATVEVAHEAILREWERLANWIEVTQDDHRTLSRMKRDARLWDQRERPDHLRPNAELLHEFHLACTHLAMPIDDPVLQAFTEHEQARLLRELENIDTPHHRRAWIGERLSAIGDTRPGVGLRPDGLPDIEWCYVPVESREITLTFENVSRLGGSSSKKQDYTFTVAPFYIAKYLITHAQFQAFVDDPAGFNNDTWWQGLNQAGFKQEISTPRMAFANSPRDGVSWYQAMAFTCWLNAKLPQESGIIRLPTEWEWQWAASGGQSDFQYPWGGDLLRVGIRKD